MPLVKKRWCSLFPPSRGAGNTLLAQLVRPPPPSLPPTSAGPQPATEAHPRPSVNLKFTSLPTSLLLLPLAQQGTSPPPLKCFKGFKLYKEREQRGRRCSEERLPCLVLAQLRPCVAPGQGQGNGEETRLRGQGTWGCLVCAPDACAGWFLPCLGIPSACLAQGLAQPLSSSLSWV